VATEPEHHVDNRGTTGCRAHSEYASAKRSDTKRYARYFHGMLERGVFLAPSQFEAAFVSLAHTDADIAFAARAAAEALAAA